MGEYFDALTDSMTLLSTDPRVVFIGQAVAFPGTAMANTLAHIPDDRKIELPVAEDMQMGMAIGMSLQGLLPVCIYPRFNFMLLAINQLVLHLDKLPLYSQGGYKPRVLIRTAIATDQPLNPGEQHLGDFSDAIRLMLKTITLQRLKSVYDVHSYYQYVTENTGSFILVEDAALY